MNGEAGEMVPSRRSWAGAWRRLLPLVISLALVVWVLHGVPLGLLAAALIRLNWSVLCAATASLVFCLYLWDSFCVRWTLKRSGVVLGYRMVLRCRGSSYLVGSLNYSLGQGLLAWLVAQAAGLPLATALARLLLIAYHDLWLLLGLGLASSLGRTDVLARVASVLCGTGMALLAFLTSLRWLFFERWPQSLQGGRWQFWPNAWTARNSCTLAALRFVNFAITGTYVAIGLSMIGVPWRVWDIVRTVSFVQLAEAIPLTASGLGSRETILVTVIRPIEPEMLLGFGLIWSSGLILGRLAIGLWIVLMRGSVVPQDILAVSAASATMASRGNGAERSL